MIVTAAYAATQHANDVDIEGLKALFGVFAISFSFYIIPFLLLGIVIWFLFQGVSVFWWVFQWPLKIIYFLFRSAVQLAFLAGICYGIYVFFIHPYLGV